MPKFLTIDWHSVDSVVQIVVRFIAPLILVIVLLVDATKVSLLNDYELSKAAVIDTKNLIPTSVNIAQIYVFLSSYFLSSIVKDILNASAWGKTLLKKLGVKPEQLKRVQIEDDSFEA